jgi:ferrous iron transport protein A
MDLTQLEVGRNARVVEIRGGRGIQDKLNDIGIVPGRTIGKSSQALLKGPVVLSIGPTQVAIGFGMARKIVVDPLDFSRR